MQFSSISLRMFFWLLMISLLPLIFISEFFLNEFSTEIQKTEIKHLARMSDKKIEQINTYISERILDVETLAKSPIISKAILEISNNFNALDIVSKSYLEIDRRNREYLTNILTSDYNDLFLVTSYGDVVFSIRHNAEFTTNLFHGKFKKSGLAIVTRNALSVLETNVSSFEFYKPSQQTASFIATPILMNGKLLGVLVLQIKIEKILDVVKNNVGLGKTGETVIARKNNDFMSFLGPLKFNEDSEFSFEISFDSDLAKTMQLALSGEGGQGISVDYRGENVIAVWRYLPVFHWGVVVKEDVREAFYVVQNMNELRWFILFSIVIVIIIVAYLIGQSIVNPIKILTNAANQISSGNLYKRVTVNRIDEVGQLANTFNHMTDELQKSQVELKEKIDEVEKANHAKSEFLSRMSHELRTPLNAILGFSQLLVLDSVGLTETQKNNITEIIDAGHHLLNLINEVLDLAKIESGKLEIFMEQVSLDKVIKKCIVLISPQAELRKIKINDQVSGKGYIVFADNSRLKQVLLNLLSNAVKYNSEQGRIKLSSDLLDKQRIRLSVTDTGNGLSQEQVNKLFHSFERLNSIENVEGTGIGLVITKHMIELMGGSIGVESSLHHGSIFWIELAFAKDMKDINSE